MRRGDEVRARDGGERQSSQRLRAYDCVSGRDRLELGRVVERYGFRSGCSRLHVHASVEQLRWLCATGDSFDLQLVQRNVVVVPAQRMLRRLVLRYYEQLLPQGPERLQRRNGDWRQLYGGDSGGDV